MIDFHRVNILDRDPYNRILMSCPSRGCEYAFANIFMWGRQQIAFQDGCVLFFSHYNGRSLYPYPIGSGDKKAALEAVIADAAQRGIPCRIACMTESDRQELEQLIPGIFTIRPIRDTADYVYDIQDLADLKGRKFQKKRNHYHRFCALFPEYRVLPITAENLDQARDMAEQWYETRLASDPDGDYMLEQIAMERAFCQFENLGLEGLMLANGEQVLAMTMASPMGTDTWDVHFEKAREDAEGAYAAINAEFARYMRLQHPELLYLDREDDMGLEGLRKAKLSYNPHHMVDKYWAFLGEESDEF